MKYGGMFPIRALAELNFVVMHKLSGLQTLLARIINYLANGILESRISHYLVVDFDDAADIFTLSHP